MVKNVIVDMNTTIMNMVNVMTLTVIVMSIIMSAMTRIVIATTMAMSMVYPPSCTTAANL